MADDTTTLPPEATEEPDDDEELAGEGAAAAKKKKKKKKKPKAAGGEDGDADAGVGEADVPTPPPPAPPPPSGGGGEDGSGYAANYAEDGDEDGAEMSAAQKKRAKQKAAAARKKAAAAAGEDAADGTVPIYSASSTADTPWSSIIRGIKPWGKYPTPEKGGKPQQHGGEWGLATPVLEQFPSGDVPHGWEVEYQGEQQKRISNAELRELERLHNISYQEVRAAAECPRRARTPAAPRAQTPQHRPADRPFAWQR